MATLEKLAEETVSALKDRGLKLVTAESCTGGGIGYWITSVPGCSDCFDRGFITYSNEAKIEQLGVNPLTLDAFGAVSEQIVREMAEGALKNSNADISIAITGIAGPSGGTPDKPVGTVWLGVARRNQPTRAVIELFNGNRQEIREQAIAYALTLLYRDCTASQYEL